MDGCKQMEGGLGQKPNYNSLHPPDLRFLFQCLTPPLLEVAKSTGHLSASESSIMKGLFISAGKGVFLEVREVKEGVDEVYTTSTPLIPLTAGS